MTNKITKGVLSLISTLFPGKVTDSVFRMRTRKLKNEVCGETTKMFLIMLLNGMDLAFCLFKDYRENIVGFKGRYFFRTVNEPVAYVVFENGDMKKPEKPPEAPDQWDVRITFSDTEALKKYLLSGGQDSLTPILQGEIEIDGNSNYIYKYGFLARDLANRLGVLGFV